MDFNNLEIDGLTFITEKFIHIYKQAVENFLIELGVTLETTEDYELGIYASCYYHQEVTHFGTKIGDINIQYASNPSRWLIICKRLDH